MPRFSRRLAVGVIAAASLFAGASSAQAGPLVASAQNCADQPLSRPFTPWLDYMQYTPLTSGEQSLAAGESLTSPSICVGLEHPTLRFFAKRESGGPLTGALRVEVLFTGADGNGYSLPIGTVSNNGTMQPTAPMLILANVLGLGEQTPVSFRYTALNSSWTLGDVWVDPWGRK